MTEWQPIETAPRNGELALVYDGDPDGAPVVAWWDGDQWVVDWDGQSYHDAFYWSPIPHYADIAGHAEQARPDTKEG